MNEIYVHIPNLDWIFYSIIGLGVLDLGLALMRRRRNRVERQILDELRGIRRELDQLTNNIPIQLGLQLVGNSGGDSMNAGQSERFQIVGLNAAGQPVTGYVFSNVVVTPSVGTATLNPTSDPSVFDFVDPTAGTAVLGLAATLTDPNGVAYNLTGSVSVTEATDNIPTSLGLTDLGPTPAAPTPAKS